MQRLTKNTDLINQASTFEWKDKLW